MKLKRLLLLVPIIFLLIACEKITELDTNPTQVVLFDIEYQDTLMVFRWSVCMDEDFFKYNLLSSNNESMEETELLFESSNRIDTTFTKTITGPLTYYQVQVMNLDDEKSLSNIIVKQLMFSKIFGGSSHDWGHSIQHTTDGGYVISGLTQSFGNGWGDIWLIKTDSNGNVEWNKTFGGSDHDKGYSVQQTTDGGYIITGYTMSYGNSESNIWLIKADSQGNEEWNKTFGNSNWNNSYSVQQTIDGGYIIGGNDIIKTDSQGNEEWIIENNYGMSVQQTTDNGYIFTGGFRLNKIDSNGNEEWSQTFGDGDSYSVQQTTDDGYIIAGYTMSFGNGENDIWLIKTDSQGSEEWDQTFGGSDDDRGHSVQQTDDGGYIITGSTESFGNSSSDIWLIKTDSNGHTVPFGD